MVHQVEGVAGINQEIPSVSPIKTSLIECIAASTPARWPAHTCKGPVASLSSSFKRFYP